MGSPKGLIIPGRRKRQRRKSVCDREGRQFICFQSYLLSEHDVTRNQITLRNETPSHLWIAGLVHLSNVGSLPIVDAVSLSAVAADHVEKIHRVKLRALLCRQPTAQKTPPACFCSVSPAEAPVKFPKRTGTRRVGRPAQEPQQKVHCYRLAADETREKQGLLGVWVK